jgi:hypothetical protein
VVVVSVLWVCGRAPTDTSSRDSRTTVAPDARREAPIMTHLDPADPAAWKQAEAIAATAARGALERRSDALPFMFMADSPAAVLVHHGRVVTDKGPAAAGAYLRDLGLIDGKGPQIDDVLFVLFAFKAWPTVKGAAPEGYIHAPDAPALSELTAQVEFDGVSARVILHYWLPDPGGGAGGHGNDVGSIDPDLQVTQVRPIARATLEIARTGDASWQVEYLNWAG